MSVRLALMGFIALGSIGSIHAEVAPAEEFKPCYTTRDVVDQNTGLVRVECVSDSQLSKGLYEIFPHYFPRPERPMNANYRIRYQLSNFARVQSRLTLHPLAENRASKVVVTQAKNNAGQSHDVVLFSNNERDEDRQLFNEYLFAFSCDRSQLDILKAAKAKEYERVRYEVESRQADADLRTFRGWSAMQQFNRVVMDFENQTVRSATNPNPSLLIEKEINERGNAYDEFTTRGSARMFGTGRDCNIFERMSLTRFEQMLDRRNVREVDAQGQPVGNNSALVCADGRTIRYRYQSADNRTRLAQVQTRISEIQSVLRHKTSLLAGLQQTPGATLQQRANAYARILERDIVDIEATRDALGRSFGVMGVGEFECFRYPPVHASQTLRDSINRRLYSRSGRQELLRADVQTRCIAKVWTNTAIRNREEQFVAVQLLATEFQDIIGNLNERKTTAEASRARSIRERAQINTAEANAACLRDVQKIPIAIGTIIQVPEFQRGGNQEYFENFDITFDGVTPSGQSRSLPIGLVKVQPRYMPMWSQNGSDVGEEVGANVGNLNESASRDMFRELNMFFQGLFFSESPNPILRYTENRPGVSTSPTPERISVAQEFFMDIDVFRANVLVSPQNPALTSERSTRLKSKIDLLRALGTSGVVVSEVPAPQEIIVWDPIRRMPDRRNFYLKAPGRYDMTSDVVMSQFPSEANVRGVSLPQVADPARTEDQTARISMPIPLDETIRQTNAPHWYLNGQYDYPNEFLTHETYPHIDLMVRFSLSRYQESSTGLCNRYVKDAMALSNLIADRNEDASEEHAQRMVEQLLGLKWAVDPVAMPAVSTSNARIQWRAQTTSPAYNFFIESFSGLIPQMTSGQLGEGQSKFTATLGTVTEGQSFASLPLLRRHCVRVFSSVNGSNDAQFGTNSPMMRHVCLGLSISAAQVREFQDAARALPNTNHYAGWFRGITHWTEGSRRVAVRGDFSGRPILACLAPRGSLLVYEGGQYGHIEIKTAEAGVCDFVSDFRRDAPRHSYGITDLSRGVDQQRTLSEVLIVNTNSSNRRVVR